MMKNKDVIYETNQLKLHSKVDKFINAISKLEDEFDLYIESDYDENYDYNGGDELEYWGSTSKLIVTDADGNVIATLYSE